MTLLAAALLQACATPNSSAALGLQVDAAEGNPVAPAQAARDLAALRQVLVATGFTRIVDGPGALRPPEHQRVSLLFSVPDLPQFHGYVGLGDDGSLHVLVVDNRRGEREGFGPDSCQAVVALRAAVAQRFADRLSAPTPDTRAQQHAALRRCE